MRVFQRTATIAIVLLVVVMALQFSTAHVRIESLPPEPLIVHRGMRWLDFLPGFLGPTPLYDTGLTATDVPSSKRSAVEEIGLHPWDAPTSENLKHLCQNLESDALRSCLLYTGHWQEWGRALGDTVQKTSFSERSEAEIFPQAALLPPEAIAALLVLVTEEKSVAIRTTVAKALGQSGSRQAATVVPALLPLLQDQNRDVRSATAGALGQIGSGQAATVVPALLPLLQDQN
ncbi:MAG: HEAT repeat domain-containing protein, partial [Deltaproteobacteria bacterium]|nr:HEAT repeat domain-containing protein [Deltaproteobacteria bacterium]